MVVGKSEFELCGVVGGMMAIEMLAGTMGLLLGWVIERMRGNARRRIGG